MAATKQKSLKQMDDIVGRGESVIYQGRMITRREELPSATDIAQNDPDQARAILADAMKAREEADRVIAAMESVQRAKAEGEAGGSTNGDESGRETDETSGGEGGEEGKSPLTEPQSVQTKGLTDAKRK